MTMKCARILFLMLVACVCASAQCPPSSLAVIVNKSNPAESLSVAQLRRLLIGDVRAWPDHKPAALVSREPSSKVFQCALSSIVRLSDAEYHRYLLSAEFRGEEPMVVQTADSDAAAARWVAGSAGGIAVVDISSVAAVSSTVKVIRINGKNPGEAGYPL